MATLAVLRGKLNGEIGVVTDAETAPWTTTVRNTAISDGYAGLWRSGVWKPTAQTLAAVTDQSVYALTSIRRLKRLELLDTSGRILELPNGLVEDDNSGGYQLRLKGTIATGSSIRVLGWTAFKSQFSSDADADDMPAEDNRVPLLKAKSILFRQQLSMFARYGSRQIIPTEMNMTIDQLIGMISACEREYDEQSTRLSGMRQRAGQTRTI
jgi:hypothetical protein